MSDIWQLGLIIRHPRPGIIMKRCEQDERPGIIVKRCERCESRHNARIIRAVMRGDAACNGPEMAPMIVTCHES